MTIAIRARLRAAASVTTSTIKHTTCAAVMLTAAMTTAVFAQQTGAVQVNNAWARATPPAASAAAVYMTLTALSGDRLTGASSPASGTASVHEMHMDGTIMRMNAVPAGVELPAGKPVALQPGGYHVMLERLKAPLKEGETVPLHLMFQKALPLDIAVPVQAIGSTGPAAGPMDHATMPGMTMSK